ncbi:MAG: alpha/beta hydrolase family esterase [Geminicoccales bacterium]
MNESWRPSKDAPAPLVVALHGFLGNASTMQGKTGFDRLSKSHGFVVVYPNGKGRRWNDGRSTRNRTDDVDYLSSLIKKLITDGTADPGRIFLAGHSNGGGMSMRMACDRPDLISSIAVIATKKIGNRLPMRKR